MTCNGFLLISNRCEIKISVVSLSLRKNRHKETRIHSHLSNEILERKLLHAPEVVEVGERVHILSWEGIGIQLDFVAYSQIKIVLIVDNDSGHREVGPIRCVVVLVDTDGEAGLPSGYEDVAIDGVEAECWIVDLSLQVFCALARPGGEHAADGHKGHWGSLHSVLHTVYIQVQHEMVSQ